MPEKTDNINHPLGSFAGKFQSEESLKAAAIEESTSEKRIAGDTPDNIPYLSPRTIHAPALLLDKTLRIAWQNQAADSRIWHFAKSNGAGMPARPHLFDRIFDPQFQRKVKNWRQCLIFFIQQALMLMSKEDLLQVITERGDQQRDMIEAILVDIEPPAEKDAFSTRLRQILRDGVVLTYWVVVTTFDQGRLIVFESSSETQGDSRGEIAAELAQRMEMIRQHPHPVKMSLYVLGARLNQANTLRTEMLDEEYSRLLNRIWQSSIETVAQYSGIFCSYNGDGFLSLFIPADESEENPLHIIQCALELKSRMSEIGREWKIRKGWLHDIELNIGITSGNEYMVSIPTFLGDNVMPLGDTLQLSGCLSVLASSGQIWTTKELINRLAPNDLRQLRFGIFRKDDHRQVFVAKCFSRIRDLINISEVPFDISGDLGATAVTQIFDRQGHG